jgi:hypothetical protein
MKGNSCNVEDSLIFRNCGAGGNNVMVCVLYWLSYDALYILNEKKLL